VLGRALAVDEPDPHPGLVRLALLDLRLGDDPLHLAVDLERGLEVRHVELEQELGSDRKRAAGLDERASPRDVLGVVGEEGVEPLVLHLQLDGRADVFASIVRVACIVHLGVIDSKRAMRLGQTTSATTDPAIAGLFRLALRWWRLPLWAGLELVLGLV